MIAETRDPVLHVIVMEVVAADVAVVNMIVRILHHPSVLEFLISLRTQLRKTYATFLASSEKLINAILSTIVHLAILVDLVSSILT